MSKKDMKLEMTPIEAPATNDKESANKARSKKATATKKSNTKKRKSLGRYLRDIVSELKKVEWAKFKSTKNAKGVLAQTGVVLVIVVIFIVIITAFDLGLSELLGLLIDAGV